MHLDDYPVADRSLIDERLNEVTRLAQRVSSMGRAARSRAQIKVRQPLETVLVKTRTDSERALLETAAPQILDELNVRAVTAVSGESDVVSYVVQPNLPVLGPKYGREVVQVRKALESADPAEVATLHSAGHPVVVGEYTLEPDEVLVTTRELEGYSVSSDAGYTVAVSTEVTPELLLEGQARELVHRIQNMRRDAGFDISDYITTYYTGSDLDDLVGTHGDYIKQETLSVDLVCARPPYEAYEEEQSFDGLVSSVGVLKKPG